jgi:hypothetical protein
MKTLPLRLSPGDDLRTALEAALAAHGGQAAFVVAGIGSLREARLRFAGRDALHHVVGDLEILTLAGTRAWPPPTAACSAATWHPGASSGQPPRCCSRYWTTWRSRASRMPSPATPNS